ncbi:MarR family transcriptional regulator [Salinarchaeum laminariae]|uniref:MarR family transcriptional regulator n=1 Tax=Salinarchaeum laminariae TaxID=869888 RepID=UPI0020BFFA04|nr:MarR family transcriptional regulator [Salinarchaeum laminariae]
MSAGAEQKLAGLAATDISIPGTLDTAQSKLCYLTIDVAGAASVDELDDALDLGKLTLLDVLATLDDEGVVQRTADGRYATY